VPTQQQHQVYYNLITVKPWQPDKSWTLQRQVDEQFHGKRSKLFKSTSSRRRAEIFATTFKKYLLFTTVFSTIKIF